MAKRTRPLVLVLAEEPQDGAMFRVTNPDGSDVEIKCIFTTEVTEADIAVSPHVIVNSVLATQLYPLINYLKEAAASGEVFHDSVMV